MQKPMLQFLANFGLYNFNIKYIEAVHISIGCEMEGIFAWIYHNLSLFSKKWTHVA